MNATSLTEPRRTSWHNWDAIRPLISKLWYQHEGSVAGVFDSLRNVHGLEVSHRILKTKLKEWALVEKLNSQDAGHLLATQARLDNESKEGILILRGKIWDPKRVRKYQRRRDRLQSVRATQQVIGRPLPSKVIALLLHPHLRREPVCSLLSRFESVFREMQNLLQTAKDKDLCVPDRSALQWLATSVEIQVSERRLQLLVWEGVQAYEEKSFYWAGLCWRSAMLALEELIWEPDLNIWITFVRCCIRLVRFGANEVAQQLLDRLRWLREELPCSAAHRAFIYALSELTPEDLLRGGLFMIETTLRVVELLWPSDTSCRLENQFFLAEVQFYHGIDSAEGIPNTSAPSLVDKRSFCQEVWLERSQVAGHMLLSNYGRAETVVRNHIHQLEQRQEPAQKATEMSAALTDSYFMLGTIQFHARDDVQSLVSYSQTLRLHDEVEKIHRVSILDSSQLHRMLTLLEFLNATVMSDAGMESHDSDIYKRNLEKKLWEDLQDRVNAPFRRRPEQHKEAHPTVRTKKRGYNNDHASSEQVPTPKRGRIVQRPIPFSIDRDKCRNVTATKSIAVKNEHVRKRGMREVSHVSSTSSKKPGQGIGSVARRPRPPAPPCPGF